MRTNFWSRLVTSGFSFVVFFASATATPYVTAAAVQIGTAQIEPSCETGCDIRVTIGSIVNKGRRQGGGHDLEVHWFLGRVPPAMQLISIRVAVEVTLQRGRVQRGEITVGPDQKICVVPAKGLVTDGDAVRFKVTVTPVAILTLENQLRVEVLGVSLVERRRNGNLVAAVRYSTSPKGSCRPANQIVFTASLKAQSNPRRNVIGTSSRSGSVVAPIVGQGSITVLIKLDRDDIPDASTLRAIPDLTAKSLVGCGVTRSGSF